MSAPHGLAMQACRRCGTIDAPGRTVCAACLNDTFDTLDVPGTGTLVSWTTIRRAPTQFRDDAPYDVCVVDLDGGHRVTGRLAGPLDAQARDALRVGMPVVATEVRLATPIFSSR